MNDTPLTDSVFEPVRPKMHVPCPDNTFRRRKKATRDMPRKAYPPCWNKGIRISGLEQAGEAAAISQDAPRIHKDFLAQAGLEIVAPPVRSTNIQLFQKCPRKFLFASRLGLTPLIYERALEVGITTHEFIAELFSGTPVENLPVIMARRVAEIQAKLVDSSDVAGILPSGRTFTEQMTQIQRDAEMALAMVLVWNKYTPPSRLLEAYDLVGIEQQFALKVRGIRSPIVIKPDLILRNKRTGMLWLPDHKTTGKSVSQICSTLKFKMQARLYCWVYQEHLKAQGSKEIVGGWIHNVMKKPGVKYCPNGKDREHGFSGYVQRVSAWYDEQEEKNPNEPVFAQSVVSAPSPLLDEELLLQVIQTSLAANCRIDLARFHKADHNCYEWNKPCPYLRICDESPAKWPELIKANYVQRFRDRDEAETEEGDNA